VLEEKRFDGDECNLHVPQSINTVIELNYIADVRRQIINPGSSKPTIGCVQDSILGAFLLTSPNTKITGKEAMNILLYTNLSLNKIKKLDKNKVYSGQDIYSMIIPDNINVHYKKDGKTTFKYINGKMDPESRLTKEQLGPIRNSLIHHVWDQHKHEQTKYFIDNTRKLILRWLINNGFSVGMKDIVVDSKLRKEFDIMVVAKKLQANHLITEMENNNVLRDFDLFETSLAAELNVLRDNVSKLIVNTMTISNSLYVMLTSQSKGSALNVGQMTGILGQQDIEGKRIQKKVNGRTLPHFHQDDDSITARGFVENCFLKGLSPHEFFFHTMSGRQGLIDTAIKSVTGDTPIIIIENKNAKYVNIGDWIDNHLKNNPTRIKRLTSLDTELLELANDIYVPTTNKNGNVSWGIVSAVTRHDPGKTLYEIKTHGGRNVIVTESKSLLIWNNNEFQQTLTKNVKVGDCVPVTMNLLQPPIINNKYELSDNIIMAPSEHIKGLLRKYFSESGVITHDSVSISSTSKQFIDIINTLCSRLGIFGVIYDQYTYTISDSWITQFYDDVLGIHVDINVNKQFDQINDVVLDKIISIIPIDATKYPKVYDITVPDTTNFCLANGLHVVDTADTGYIQRKLVKKLEDFMVKYDGTVRNAKNLLTQCIYGDTGYNTISQIDQRIPIISMSNDEIREKYIFDIDEVKKYKISGTRNNEFFKELKNLRDILRESQMKSIRNYNMIKESYMLPVNFSRLIDNVKYNEKLSESKESLEFDYVMSTLITLMDHKFTPVMKMSENQINDTDSIKIQDEKLSKTVFNAALYDYLAPKKLIVEHKLNKNQFDTLVHELIKRFREGLVEPGEMVGTVAAQSIGEPATQLSLGINTFLLVEHNGKTKCIQIGEFIDGIMKDNKDDVKTHNRTSQVLDVDEGEIKILSVGKKEKVKWSNVTQLSRHPANGDLITVTTATGRCVTATKSHSFLMRNRHGVIPVKGSDLEVGDRIPIAKNTPTVNDPVSSVRIGEDKYNLDEDLCEFIGFFVAEGSTCKSSNKVCITSIVKEYQELTKRVFRKFTDNKINQREKEGRIMGSKKKYKGMDTYVYCDYLSKWLRENCGTYSQNKRLPGFVFGLSKKRLGDVLRALFDGDGNVAPNRKSIKYHSTSEVLIQQVALALSYFDITCSYQVEREGHEDEDGTLHDLWCLLVYGAENGKKFFNQIGSCIQKKYDGMESISEEEDKQAYTDQIPCVAEYINKVGRGLKLPGASRNYGRWVKKEQQGKCIGRRTLRNYVELFEEADKNNRISRNQFADEIKKLKQAVDSDVFWDEIVSIKTIRDPDELVYDFSVEGDETFVILNGMYVHNTLNSVDYNEEVIIKKPNNTLYKGKVGEFIDTMIKDNKSKVTKIVKGDQSYLETRTDGLSIMSIDENAGTGWRQIEAVTKHLPINKDGSDTLLKVTTYTGRSATATKAKGFLIYEKGKIVEIEGDKLKLGMMIPIVYDFKLKDSECSKYVDVTQYFPRTEYVYGTDMKIARKTRESVYVPGRPNKWYDCNNGTLFTLPYARSDIASEAFSGKIRVRKGVEVCKTKQEYLEGCIYPLKCTKTTSQITEKLLLDELFGFFIGAYLAEGCATDTYVAIANNDKKYRDVIDELSKRLCIGTHVQEQLDKNEEGWTSTDIKLHSTLMAKFVRDTCGHLAHNKFVPAWAFNAPTEFLRGLMNGYFSGDGCIEDDQITSSSVSQRLTFDIQILLYRFGIYGRITRVQQKKNNLGTKNIKPGYVLTIRNKFAKTFANEFKLVIKYKQKALNNILKATRKTIHSETNLVSYDNKLIKRNDLFDMINKKKTCDKEFWNMTKACASKVFYDPIIKIEPVASSHSHVYDFTVQCTKTFILSSGFACFDTFHMAGVSEKGVGTLGVPRLRELMSLTKNPKTPRTIIHIQKEYADDKIMCSKIASYIKYTTISDVTQLLEIYYDPEPKKSDSIMKNDGVDNPYVALSSSKASCQTDINGLPWLIRIVLDREKILEKDVVLMDIKMKFCEYWGSRYVDTKGMKKEDKLLMEKITKCAVLSNYDNSDTPIIHIRVNMNGFDKSTLINFKELVLNRIKLKGVEGITNIKSLSYDPHVEFDENGAIQRKNRYVIYADGTSIGDIRYIKGVDLKRTTTNNITEIYRYFGIEAARNALIKEYKVVLEANGSGTNYQHWSILVDSMTGTHTMVSVDRHGMDKLNNDPLPSASFEKPVEKFQLAALYRERDSMESVAARIMTGQGIRGGTGLCQLMLDTKLLENTELPNTSDEWKKGAGYKKVVKDKLIDDLLSKKDESDAFLPS
jgi:DNA-directed RNA polymerase beta' subunit